MKRILSIVCIALMSMGMAFAKGEKQVVVFDVDLHCQNCINKVQQNIAFEKGVKDLQCSLDTKTVQVTYDSTQTNVATLQKAFSAIGKTATVNTTATAAVKANNAAKSAAGSAKNAANNAKSAANNAKSKATSAVNSAKSKASSAANSVHQTADSVKHECNHHCEQFADSARSTYNRGKHAAEQVTDSVRSTYNRGKHAAEQVTDSARSTYNRGKYAAEQVTDSVRSAYNHHHNGNVDAHSGATTKK